MSLFHVNNDIIPKGKMQEGKSIRQLAESKAVTGGIAMKIKNVYSL